ncbi:hypothetical protein PPN31114_00080 [Pandoraea pneumonica]|uniref:Uncharacterized protein n=1 Tax=Pandoraea pneumonica TaxID=2508299 RepID=A0A5E4RFB7_9BURK|nr:hypothetical protein PPN31114_00080 [Pandoraea pneumonica]
MLYGMAVAAGACHSEAMSGRGHGRRTVVYGVPMACGGFAGSGLREALQARHGANLA